MKRAWLLFGLILLVSPSYAGSLYPMEGGDLRRENHSLDLTVAATPMTLVWTGAGCHSEPCSNPVILSDRVVQANREAVICRALCSGQTLWTWEAATSVGLLWNPPVYDSTRNLLYQSAEDGAVVALRPSDGQPQWTLYEGSRPGVVNQASATYYNNMIYYGNANQSFVCVNADTRAQIWRFTFDQPQGAVTPAIDGGFIYIAGSAGEIACLNATTGVVQWDIQTNCFQYYASAILLTDNFLYCMTSQGLAVCRNRLTGALVWQFQTDSWTQSNLSLGDQIYCTSDDRCLYKLNQNTGAEIWRTCFAGNFARSGPFYCGGEIFASGCANVYYGVDSNGNTNFSYNEGTDNSFVDWAEADGLIYVTNRVGVMSCFAPAGVPLPAGCTPTFSPTISATSTPNWTATISRTPSPNWTATISRTPTPNWTPTISPTPTQPYDVVPIGDNPTGIGPNQAGIYPNPVKGGLGRFVYQMSAGGTARVRVFRADGSICGQYTYEHTDGGLKDVPCDMSSYAAGVYFFIVDRDGDSGQTSQTILEKFIVIK